LVRNPKGPKLMEKLKQGSFDFEWDECSGYERAICAVQIIVGIVVNSLCEPSVKVASNYTC